MRLQLSYRVAADQTYHDELTLAKAPGTTLNSTEATAAMSWSFIVTTGALECCAVSVVVVGRCSL